MICSRGGSGKPRPTWIWKKAPQVSLLSFSSCQNNTNINKIQARNAIKQLIPEAWDYICKQWPLESDQVVFSFFSFFNNQSLIYFQISKSHETGSKRSLEPLRDTPLIYRKASRGDAKVISKITTVYGGNDYLSLTIDDDLKDPTMHHFVCETNGIICGYVRGHEIDEGETVVFEALRVSEGFLSLFIGLTISKSSEGEKLEKN